MSLYIIYTIEIMEKWRLGGLDMQKCRRSYDKKC